jgi:hypothetical protein
MTITDLITPADLRAWDACYRDDQIARHFAGRAALTPAELVACAVPDRDKVWVLCRVLVRRDPWLAFDLVVHCARLEFPWVDRVTELVERVAGLRGKSEAECLAVETEAWGLSAVVGVYAAAAARVAANADDAAAAVFTAVFTAVFGYRQIIAKALDLLATASSGANAV